MKTFKSHKLVTATPMTREEYNTYRNWTLPADEQGSDEGYLVEYLDSSESNHPKHKGYISWSPKAQFDSGYTEVDSDSPKDRLIIEIRELREKLGKINEFKAQAKPDFVCWNAWHLLEPQAEAMQNYLSILEVRLNLFK